MYDDIPAARRVVILGVAASDAHAVANQLIAMMLRERGLVVVNLGVCTPLAEFAAAHQAHPEALAVAIGSLNGHAYEDLRELPVLRAAGRLGCPVIVGGNLSVGSHKDGEVATRLYGLGVDHVLTDADDLAALLDRLLAAESRTPRRASGADRAELVEDRAELVADRAELVADRAELVADRAELVSVSR